MKRLDNKQKNTLFKVFCSLLLCAALLCDMLMIGLVASVEESWEINAGIMLGLAFIFISLYDLLFFGYKQFNEKDKLNFSHIIYAVVCAAAGIASCCVGKDTQLFGIVGTIYFIVPIIKRIISVIRKHNARNIIFNILAGLVFIALLAITAMTIGEEKIENYLLSGFMPGAVVAITCLFYICTIALSNFNNNVLKKIIRKTYAGEVLFGLILLVVAFSMVLVMVEPAIETYGDALWYCFMLVTTIGFGDLTSVSMVGRILSIILGLYGIVVVALVTSVIVNFYNEVKEEDRKKEEAILEDAFATDYKEVDEENKEEQEVEAEPRADEIKPEEEEQQ